MAEILLSLTIIGVVAAITLPSLTGNINERTWNTQRKALYARFSQAISLMPSLNGYGILEEGDPNKVAEIFVTNGLAKVLKINNICDYEHLTDCGIPTKVSTINGEVFSSFPQTIEDYHPGYNSVPAGIQTNSSISLINTKGAAFETQNGESIAVFYNPNCSYNNQNTTQNTQYMVCANFVYDLNGNKGPNTFGKDMGALTALYATDSVVVAPVPLTKDAGTLSNFDAAKVCKSQDTESRLPNKEELASLFFNKYFWGMSGFRSEESDSFVYWSNTLQKYNNDVYAWDIRFDSGHLRLGVPRSHRYPVRCIKR